MANLNWLKQARVSVPNRSGFDKSFRNLLTAKVGTLVPILCDEVVPGQRTNLRIALQAQLPPLASDTFMRCKIKCEAFFVPKRLMYGGFEAWLTGDDLYDSSSGSYVSVDFPVLLIEPGSAAAKKAQTDLLKPGTLADYLGYKFSSSEITTLQSDSTGAVGTYFNIEPFIGYHLIYDSWYRNTKIQNKVFSRPVDVPMANLSGLSYLPYKFFNSSYSFRLTDTFVDGVKLGELRQRNFGSDYFTECTPQAQQGSPQTVTIDSNSQFSISALRAANSIQQWLERNNLAGFKLQDYLRANYGCSLSDGVAQRPLFLGTEDFDIYSKGVEQNSRDASQSSNNPFDTVGTRYGNAYATGDGVLVDDFVANEPGYIYVIASLVPHVTYASGILRQNLRYTSASSQSDLATPLLQNVGNQPTYAKELVSVDAFLTSYRNLVFGYIDRYADFMTREDELHGILRDGETLQSFALQRSVSGNVGINTNFLKIPVNFMDNVTAVSASLSDYGYWLDCYFDYKMSAPLAQYCQPSLQDPAYEHGEKVVVRRSGSRL